MASSESIPSTLNDAVALQRSATHLPAAVKKTTEWAQLTADFITIALALAFAHCLLTGMSPYRISLRETMPSVVSAIMIATICAFTGAYSRQETPLNIGNTVGLVKGLCCAAILELVNHLYGRDTNDVFGLTVLPIIPLLLVVQREAIGALTTNGHQALLYMPFKRPTGHERTSRTVTSAESPVAGFMPRSSGDSLKRTVDLCAGSFLLVVLSPVFLIVAIAIRLESAGPALLRQRRIGRDGIPFYMWKFRSMYDGARRYAPSPTSDTDPRITRIGRLIRRFSIDETPQLLNVLAGDMSLVGPRPEMPFIVATYTSYERLRLTAKPGMTGLWQISPARAMPIHKNVHLDLFYIQHQSLFLDIAIMLRTATATIRGIGAA